MKCYLTLAVLAAASAVHAAEPTGGFFVHLNQQSNNSDSRRAVTFYDADDLNSGSASPIFAVHVPGDQYGPGSFNAEELSSIATDPETGDVYILSFDSGTAGNVSAASGDSPADSDGDYDLYRIDFGLVYDHWSSNFEGTTVTAGTTPGVGGLNPFIPAGAPAGGFDDYITYGSTPLYDVGPGFGFQFDSFGAPHPNTFSLAGAISKIGEIERNPGDPGFYDLAMEFVDSDTLVIIDNSIGPDTSESSATDHQYRVLSRVSTSPGAAVLNNGTSESWNSTVGGFVDLDFAPEPGVHSNPESAAYHQDPLTGVRGIWVTESDGGGDDIAFWDLDTQSYREQSTGGGQTAFALDNDPFVNAASNDGKADNIFVDADTGDLIIIESGFADVEDGIDTVDREPAVIRREVITYDNGLGQIQFGAWSEKVILTPEKDGGSDGGFLERGSYSAYDSENDLVYFYNPGGGGDYDLGPNGIDDGGPGEPGSDDIAADFQMDIQVLDINTGETITLNNVDESVGFFNAFADVADFFTLGEDEVLFGDFEPDGDVDIADFGLFADAFGSMTGDPNYDIRADAEPDGDVDIADFGLFADNFGIGTGAAVPEPTTALLAAFAAAGLLGRRNG